MDRNEFERSLREQQPPAGMPPLLGALWWDAQGDWQRAHAIAQEVESRDGAWVHAYLHRREGDAANARYWYRQAGQPVSQDPPEREREAIVEALLATGKPVVR